MTDKTSFDKTGLLWTLGSVVTVGFSGFMDKLGTNYIANPLWYSLVSLLFALVFSLIYLGLTRRVFSTPIQKTQPNSWLILALLGIISSGLFTILRFYGLKDSTATFASLSQVLTSVLTVFFASIIFRERLPKVFNLLFPVILVATYFFSTASLTFTPMKQGDLLIIAAALLLAGGNMVGKLATRLFTVGAIAIGRTVFGFLLVLIAIVLIHPHPLLFNSLLILPIISGAMMAINFFCYYEGVRRCGVGFTTSFLMASPIITKLLSFVFLGEKINFLQTACFIVILVTGYTIVHGTMVPRRLK